MAPLGKDPHRGEPATAYRRAARGTAGECRHLESRLRDAGRKPSPSDPGPDDGRLGDIQADLALYAGLLSERVAQVGRQVAGTESAATDGPSPDGAPLGAAVAALARGMRCGAEEAEVSAMTRAPPCLTKSPGRGYRAWYLDAPLLAQDPLSVNSTPP
jgi:hypothetical protein